MDMQPLLQNIRRKESLDGSLAPLEALPAELVWMIIDYAPEFVLELRTTSSVIRSRVDAYALQGTTIPLVHEFSVRFDTRITTPYPFLKINRILGCTIKTHALKTNLFVLRLKVFELPKRMNILRKDNESITTFKIAFDVDNDDVEILEYLSTCMGMRVDKVDILCTLGLGLQRLQLPFITKLLGKIKFMKMKFSVDALSEVPTEFLLKTIKTHEVDHLRLYVKSAANPVQVLLDLASALRSIEIFQNYASGVEDNSRYFFGLHNFDWTQTIIEMFSKKMDTLYIYNYTYWTYLRTSEKIRELVTTLGKKVCFKTCCKSDIEFDYIQNEHAIQVRKSFFTVKHLSRQEEPAIRF